MAAAFRFQPAAGRRGRIDPYWWFVAPLLAVILGLYLVPLIDVLLLSVTDPEPGFGNFERLLTGRGPLRILGTTFRICAVTTLLAVGLGFVVAHAMAHMPPRPQRLLLVIVLIPFWISVLVRAFSWLALLRGNGLVNEALLASGLADEPLRLVRNELGVIIGMVHYLTPYAVLPLFAVMRSIDQRLIAASRSLGASAATTFCRVYLPQTYPGLLAATAIVFVFGLGFFVTPAILGGGRVVMLSEYVSVTVLQTLRWGFGAAQAVVLILVTFLAIGVLAKTVGLRKGIG